MVSRAPSHQHVPALDGVRGLAILAVLIFHSATFGTTRHIEAVVRQLVGFGWAGVDLFFVLSGFLITGILLDAQGSPTYYRAFYLRRVLRIFPLYFAYCAVLFVGLPLWYGWGSPESAALMSAAPWYLTYTLNVRQALANDITTPAVLGTAFFWSLCVEEQFYAVWPWVVAHLTRERLAQFCLSLTVLAVGVRVACLVTQHGMAAYVLLPARMDGLAVGAWLACMVRRRGGRERLARAAPAALLVAGLGLVGVIAYRSDAGSGTPQMLTVGMSLNVLASGALIVLATTPQSLAERVFTARWLRWLGRYAYGLYVLSVLGEQLARRSGFFNLVPERFAGSALPAATWHLALTIAISGVLALVSMRWLERPALALKRFFPYAPQPQAASHGRAADFPLAGTT